MQMILSKNNSLWLIHKQFTYFIFPICTDGLPFPTWKFLITLIMKKMIIAYYLSEQLVVSWYIVKCIINKYYDHYKNA